MGVLSAAVLLALATAAAAAAAAPTKSVAIIGSGIAGSSTAHFLRAGAADLNITVIEASSFVGGRVHELEILGQQVEAGGAAIHSANAYMLSFCKFLGLSCPLNDTAAASTTAATATLQQPQLKLQQQY